MHTGRKNMLLAESSWFQCLARGLCETRTALTKFAPDHYLMCSGCCNSNCLGGWSAMNTSWAQPVPYLSPGATGTEYRAWSQVYDSDLFCHSHLLWRANPASVMLQQIALTQRHGIPVSLSCCPVPWLSYKALLSAESERKSNWKWEREMEGYFLSSKISTKF